MGLADELLEDAHFLAAKGIADQRQTLMRRSISTAYYAAFHLFIEDFVEHWEFPDQRARLGRMFGHSRMSTGFTPKNRRPAAHSHFPSEAFHRKFADEYPDPI